MICTGKRGGPKLITPGYSFVRNKFTARSTYWRCSKRRSANCSAKCTTLTRNRNQTLIVNVASHTHKPDYAQFVIE